MGLRAYRVPKGKRIWPKVTVKKRSPNQSARTASIGIIVLHSTESHNRKGSSDLESIANFFASPAAQASSHVTNDADGHSARHVADSRKAWTVGNLNSISLNLEQIGFAAQGRAAWRQRDAQLHETARWIAYWCRRYGLPIKKAKLSSGGGILRKGVTTHAYCSTHGAGTSHWDPGSYPMGYVLWLARGYAKAQRRAKKG